MAYNYNYQPSFTSISSILRDQRELELNPIITATQRANLEAQQSVAEFQGNLVKDQVKQWNLRDREAMKDTYMKNAKYMATMDPKNPMYAILEAENADIISKLKS